MRKNSYKKIIILASLIFLGISLLTPLESTFAISTSDYQFLAPLPDPSNPGQPFDTLNVSTTDALEKYLNLILKLVIGFAAVLAVLMIIWGGIQYITSELPGVKGEGKKRISDAILGLLVALGAWLLLYTINPSLINTNVNIAGTTITGVDVPQVAINGKFCGIYDDGAPWDTATAGPIMRSSIPAGISVPKGECTKVGEPNCTSTRTFLYIIPGIIKQKCPTCQIVITGGTECWLHGLGSRHKPNDTGVDFRATPTLNEYITGNTAFPTDPGPYPKDGMSFLAEQPNQTINTTAGHWHSE